MDGQPILKHQLGWNQSYKRAQHEMTRVADHLLVERIVSHSIDNLATVCSFWWLPSVFAASFTCSSVCLPTVPWQKVHTGSSVHSQWQTNFYTWLELAKVECSLALLIKLDYKTVADVWVWMSAKQTECKTMVTQRASRGEMSRAKTMETKWWSSTSCVAFNCHRTVKRHYPIIDVRLDARMSYCSSRNYFLLIKTQCDNWSKITKSSLMNVNLPKKNARRFTHFLCQFVLFLSCVIFYQWKNLLCTSLKVSSK